MFKYEGIIRKIILDYKFNEKSHTYLTFTKFILKNKNVFEKIKSYDLNYQSIKGYGLMNW